MKREYRGFIEIKGQVRAKSHPMQLAKVLTWLAEQKRLHSHLMRSGRDWQVYYEAESILDPNKKDFNIRRRELSEQEKTVNKYL
jgi:hypothetical protein